MRKFVIGIVSFAVVLGIFVLYSRIDKTPPININTGTGSGTGIFDSNSSDSNNIGKIGDVGIGTTNQFEFITRNPESSEIERKFGFQKLLHTEGDLWELENPYMEIYRKDFTCSMKADHGVVQVEKIGGDTIPKNATFSGNVVINILPGKKGNLEESTIYLDNLRFSSEKSQLATSGVLRFVSKNVQVSGTGMELVYNSDLERLEFFRIIKLDKMNVRIKRATLGTISQTKQPAEIAADEAVDKNINDQNEVTSFSQTKKQPENKYYTCLFSKNVLIDTPDQLVFASREIEIDDILWSEKMYDENEPNKSVAEEVDSNDPNRVIDKLSKPYQMADETNNPSFNANDNEPNDSATSPDDLIDVVLSCDNGFIVTPKDSRKLSEFKAEQNFNDTEKPVIENGAEKTTLITQKIQLTALEGDSIASGQTQLTFYVEDLNAPDPNLQSYPVTITSQKSARFIKVANQVIFEGNSICRIPEKQINGEKDITFSSPMLIINLPKSKPENVSSLSDIIAIGPTELVFYVQDSNTIEAKDPNTIEETPKITPVRITSQEKALFLPAMNQVIFDKDCLCEVGSEETGKERYVSLKSSNIKIDLPREYSAQSFAFSDITAAGPIDLKFFMKDPNNMGTPQALLPVNITAIKQAQYISSTRQIVVDGSCRTSMLRQDTDFIQELTLLAERITVDLPEDINDNNPTSSLTQIRHLNADSNQVTLTVTKKAKAGLIPNQTHNQVLGWTKLICKSLDYDTEEQIFKSTGPGQLTVSDTEIKNEQENESTPIIGKRWYADTNGFSELEYLLNNNRIIANSEPNKPINIRYMEIENGKQSPVLIAAAGHVEIQLKETDDGKIEPSTIVASGGIDYQKDEDNRFLGSVLIYDHEKSTITIHGDEKNPCYNNGFLADEIFIDLANNSIKVESNSTSSF